MFVSLYQYQLLLCSAAPEFVAEEDVWTYVNGGKGEWRKMHREELRNLNSSSNINRPFKKRAKKCGEHVAHTGDRREGKGHLEDLGVDGR